MNTTTRFFQTKEQHKAFRKAFAAAQNDKACRKSYSPSTASVWDSETKAYKTIPTKIKHDGWMCSAHYLLFNLVTGKNYYNGFTPKTKEIFISSGGQADRGLNGAIDHLSEMIACANNLLGNNVVQAPSWIKDKKQWLADKTISWQNSINAFLLPFGGVFTLQDLARVQLPSFPGLTAEQVKEKVTYKQAYGDQVVDQTPDEEEPIVEATAADFGMTVEPEPKKKGLLARMFG